MHTYINIFIHTDEWRAKIANLGKTGCCSVLQCVAVCSSGLPCVAVGCSGWQWVAVCSGLLSLSHTHTRTHTWAKSYLRIIHHRVRDVETARAVRENLTIEWGSDDWVDENRIRKPIEFVRNLWLSSGESNDIANTHWVCENLMIKFVKVQRYRDNSLNSWESYGCVRENRMISRILFEFVRSLWLNDSLSSWQSNDFRLNRKQDLPHA